MGNDGGSIPTRRELVKEAVRNPTTTELKESQHEQQEYHWTTDPISQMPLAQPIVSDALGKLYNKDTILEYLVEGLRKEEVGSVTLGAIKSLKDVVEVKFETDIEASTKRQTEIWRCPITGDRLGPGSKAVYLVPCGHAFSGAAIKEVSGEKCLICDAEYTSNDVIPILPTSEIDIARLLSRIKTLQEDGLSHSLKKAPSGSKKRKKKDESAEPKAESKNGDPMVDSKTSTSRTSTTVRPQAESNGRTNINNVATASLTAKVLEEQEIAKKRKLNNENVRSLFSSRDQSKLLEKRADFMTRGYSIPSVSKR